MKVDILLAFILVVLVVEGKKAKQKLKECCDHYKESDKFCIKTYCDFSLASRERIINAVRDCKDKGKTLERLWTCAANKHDHTKCCTNHGVPPICLNYCAAHNGPPVSVGAELLCLGFIDQIRKCFRVHLEHNPLYLSKGKN